MQWRRAQNEDIPAIKRLWSSAGYGFDFPEIGGEKIISSWIAEEDGKIVCWSGAQLQPEVISILDASWGSPHERMKIFGRFHTLLAQDVSSRGFDRVFCTTDPKFARFGEHLKKFGWLKGWEYWFHMTSKVLGKRP